HCRWVCKPPICNNRCHLGSSRYLRGGAEAIPPRNAISLTLRSSSSLLPVESTHRLGSVSGPLYFAPAGLAGLKPRKSEGLAQLQAVAARRHRLPAAA